MNNFENSTPDEDKNETKSDSNKKKSRHLASKAIKKETANSSPEEPKRLLDLFEANKKAKDKTETVEEVGEKEAPLENLSQEETLTAAVVLREEARANRSNEPEEDDVAVAVHEALDDYDRKIVEEKLEPDVAFNEVIEELDLEPNEDQAEQQELEEPDDYDDQKQAVNEQEIDLSGTGKEGEVPLETPSFAELSGVEATPEDNNAGDNNHNNQPPVNHGRLNNNPEPEPESRQSNWAPNAAVEAPIAASVLARESLSPDRRDDLWTGFMIGGIVGYLIGRRRGRIKTERKLLPIKKKLEKQVTDLNERLQKQEYTIRKLVKDKLEVKPDKLSKVNTLREVTKQPEAPKLAKEVPIKAAEIHIGKLVVAEGEKPALKDKEPINHDAKIKAETMSHQELLSFSEKITINGKNLRLIYETKQISENGLRRLVNEFLGGGDLKKALKHEITEHQIDFERDPTLRDIAVTDNNTASANSNSSVILDQIIKKAEDSVASSQEEIAFLKTKASFEQLAKTKHTKQVKLINTAFTVVIAVLIAIIILLILSKNS